jgi:hypothetical protein
LNHALIGIYAAEKRKKFFCHKNQEFRLVNVAHRLMPSAIIKSNVDKPVANAAHLFKTAASCRATLKGSVGDVPPIAAPGAVGISTEPERIHKIAAAKPTKTEETLRSRSIHIAVF